MSLAARRVRRPPTGGGSARLAASCSGYAPGRVGREANRSGWASVRTRVGQAILRGCVAAEVGDGDRAAADGAVGELGRRLVSAASMVNLSKRLARCCFTAAWETTSSSATVRVDAGSVNMSRARSGRHSATRTSCSRAVSAGGASSASVSGSAAPDGSRNNRRVWPMRISSSWRTRRDDQIRSPLSQVPLEDPRSVTHQPAVFEDGVEVADGRIVEGDVVVGGCPDGRAVRLQLDSPAVLGRHDLDRGPHGA
jgi:hypothetical protein